MHTKAFQKIIWKYYKENGRVLPWRETRDPYKILVSEIMLQQTQVDRVIPKYKTFITQFPNFKTLAHAPTNKIIKAWQGLGYNRRALNLQRCAKDVVQKHNGKLPSSYTELISLPGIGPYTAGALMAFVWNKPVACIETNIRTVFIHHFFNTKHNVPDKELFPLIEQTLDMRNPREWYYALMDYGSYLKKTVGNPNTKSKHYTKQSTFKGSNRELRGTILRLLSKGSITKTKIIFETKRKPTEVQQILTALIKEGFIKRKSTLYSLV